MAAAESAMITQIDIPSFGPYKEFAWKCKDLGKLNIIYGRNYSGKTTLSRVFRALDLGKLPDKAADAQFFVRGTDGFACDHATLPATGADVRVYNRDFVAEHLSVLHDDDRGAIKTFAVVGKDNTAAMQRIADVEKQLGALEVPGSMRSESRRVSVAYGSAASALRSYRDETENLLRRHANDVIKRDKHFYDANYDIAGIKSDIRAIIDYKIEPLAEEERDVLRDIALQGQLQKLGRRPPYASPIDDLRERTRELLARSVAPTRPLDDLLADPATERWVKAGIALHDGVRDDCAFCRQPLPSGIFEILAGHFSDAAKSLDADMASAIEAIKVERTKDADLSIDLTRVYPSARASINAALAAVVESFRNRDNDLSSLIAALEARRSAPFSNVPFPEQSFDAGAGYELMSRLHAAMDANDRQGESLASEQRTARGKLRLDAVLAFIRGVDLDGRRARADELDAKCQDAKKKMDDIHAKESALDKEMRALRASLHDEREAAVRVNALLGHVLGSSALRLDAKEGSAGVTFEITRDGGPAHHLSEGERSLIAFCYFLAKLRDADSSDKDLVIYIDDPISSLDGNHIFFTYSLIESELARPIAGADGKPTLRYKQLILSTHNLDFLKYSLWMRSPFGKPHCYLATRDAASSSIVDMPSHMSKFVTEFNYLFEQIRQCAETNEAGDERVFYNFGNNLRKFLEAYLYYRFPSDADPTGQDTDRARWRIRRFFGNEIGMQLANRLSNELSHLESGVDRAMKPLDIPESRQLARYVLNAIKAKDPDQYACFVASAAAA